jgi:S-adenosylmethionine-diacylglycerol 3-amino-3-carboxypropyl transferase
MRDSQKGFIGRAHQAMFDALYARALLYNTCWEDPAVDRAALGLAPGDTLLAITSAGCNVLDYALAGVRRVHAVDANPRQTALLELKLAGIRALAYEDFYAMFGEGRHPGFHWLYRSCLREQLSPFARAFWDRQGHWFTPRNPRGSFYYRGLAGLVASAFRLYLAARPRLRDGLQELLGARSLEAQRAAYDARVAPHLWGRGVNWALSQPLTLSLLGVPGPQHDEVRRQHPGGVPGFVRDAIDYVFRALPVWTNYFWSLYLRGRYSRGCLPEYLKPENFARLKAGRCEAVVPHTATVTGFLRATDERISRFVLLDHMDWMSALRPQALIEEWQAILARATPDARVIFRSARAQPSYLALLPAHLEFHPQLAARLAREDRVHTYAGFHICDIPG